MPTSPAPDAFLRRLNDSLAAADRRLEPFRRHRRLLLEHYAGPHYPGAGSPLSAAHQPLNMIHALVSVILPHLATRAPRAMIRPRIEAGRRTAAAFQQAWDRLAERVDLAGCLRAAVTEAFFSAGVVKVGLCDAGAATGGRLEGARLSRLFVESVDLEDYLIDPAARHRDEAAFEAVRIRADRAALLHSGLYDADEVLRLPALRQQPDAPTLADRVELIEVYLPAESRVLTLGGGEDPAARRLLREAEYLGPERGPYEMLGFAWRPGSPLPIAPASVVFDLHVMINKIARRLARSADNQRDLVLFDHRAGDEAEALREAADGEMVGVQDVDRYRQVHFGGSAEADYRQMDFLLEQFRRLGGNIDLLGGLSPASNTLGQDELVHAGATLRIEDMRRQVQQLTRRVGEKMAWYLWNDPLADFDGRCGPDAPGGRPADELREYPFDVVPYSMAPDSPSRRFSRMLQWLEKVVLPTAADDGDAQLDVPALRRLTAAMLDLPEAAGLFDGSETVTSRNDS